MIQLCYKGGQGDVPNLLEACRWILQQDAFTGLLLPHYKEESCKDWEEILSISLAGIHYFTNDQGQWEPPYWALQTYAAKLASKDEDQEGRALLVLDNPVQGSGPYLDPSLIAVLAKMLADSGSALVIDQSQLGDSAHSLGALLDEHSNLYILGLV